MQITKTFFLATTFFAGATVGLCSCGSALDEHVSPDAASMRRSEALEEQAHGAYSAADCLADLEKDMEHNGDKTKMTAEQKKETVAAVLDCAGRYYPEQPLQIIARIMISNMRQESDFEPGNISGQRDGSGEAVGLLQVSPKGDAQELTLFQKHADITGIIDYRSKKPLDVKSLQKNDLKDPYINLHVATWIQSNLARSGSADPSDWGNKRGPKPSCYLTGLGSWVAGPAADDSSGYGRSGDNISADYFKGILRDLSFLQGHTMTSEDLAALKLDAKPICLRK